MRRFGSFVQKEFYHIFRDWRTLLILIGMPVAQILLFGYAITNEIQEAEIVIIDHSKTPESREISSRILESEYFRQSNQMVSEADLETLFRRGKIKQAVIIPANFARDFNTMGRANLQVIADASDPNTANITYNYTSSIVQQFTVEKTDVFSIPYRIRVFPVMMYNPELKGVFLFVPGTISVILMLISAMMTSISITREKELGTMEILLATPMAPVQIIVAKVIPYLFLALFNAFGVLVLGYFVFKVPIEGSLALLLGETALFVTTALSLGIFISSRTNSQQVALMASLMGLMLPTILLSGFIFPIENMPVVLQVISNIVPAKWFIVIIKGIMIKGQGIEYFWKETLVLVGFTLLFVVLSIKSFKLRLS